MPMTAPVDTMEFCSEAWDSPMASSTRPSRRLALNPARTPGVGIGNRQSLYDFPFLGDIDEVVLYSRVLSLAEVASLALNTCHPHRATAIAQLVNGFVVGATMTDGGCGYT